MPLGTLWVISILDWDDFDFDLTHSLPWFVWCNELKQWCQCVVFWLWADLLSLYGGVGVGGSGIGVFAFYRVVIQIGVNRRVCCSSPDRGVPLYGMALRGICMVRIPDACICDFTDSWPWLCTVELSCGKTCCGVHSSGGSLVCDCFLSP